MSGQVDRNALLETLKSFGGQANTLVVPKSFVQFTGSLESGMMLSQLLYWSERSATPNRVYKSDAEWHEELCLTVYSVRQARAKLESLGVIRTEVHRANGVPTVHYYLLEDALVEKWELWIRKNDFAKSKERNCEIAKSLTEITTEITTENKSAQSAHTEKTEPKKESPATIKAKAGIAKALQSFEETRGIAGNSAALANPQEDAKQFVNEVAVAVAACLGHPEPTANDKSATRKMHGKPWARPWLDERLRHYANGGGADLRTNPQANAYWLVNRLDDDWANRAKKTSWDDIPTFKAE